MTVHYMNVQEVANFLGVKKSTVSRLKMPPADATFGNARGWKRETIEVWAKTRETHKRKTAEK